MNRFFTSDLHIGHASVARLRNFNSIEEHDNAIIESLQKLPKKSKLWILGDIAWNEASLMRLREVSCKIKVAILGNHDTMLARTYLEVFDDIIGPVKYKKLWLSHHPIHPQEMYRCKGNVHGHIHMYGATPKLALPYYNVNWDFHKGGVPFEKIETAIMDHK